MAGEYTWAQINAMTVEKFRELLMELDINLRIRFDNFITEVFGEE